MNKLANISVLEKGTDYEMVQPGSAEYTAAIAGLPNPETVRKPMVKIINTEKLSALFYGEVGSSGEEVTGRILSYQGQRHGQCRVQLGTWNSNGDFLPEGGIIKAISEGKRNNGEWIVKKNVGPALLQKLDAGDLTQVLDNEGNASEDHFFLTTSETYSVKESEFDHGMLFCSSDREIAAKERRTKEKVVDAKATIAVEEVFLDFNIKKARYAALTASSPEVVEEAEAAAAEL